jgi:hypothetical protein
MSSKNRSDTEFRLVPLADDVEFQAAQAAVADADKAMQEAEQRHRTAQTPIEDGARWREIERTRAALTAAGENLDEVKSRKSAEVCTAFRAEHQRLLRDLLEKLEDVEGSFGRLTGLGARIAAAGHSVRSDILGVALPPAVFELGSRDDYGSQLARFRRELAAKGVV